MIKMPPSNETMENIVAELVDLQMRKIFNSAMEGTATRTMNYTTKDNSVFDKLMEDHRKYNAMTLKERTLYHTKDKYDTIICPNAHVRQVLIEEFGELNYVVTNLVKDVILFNSMEI